MKKVLLGSMALIALTACQNKSDDVEKALEQMELAESGKGRTEWSDKKVSGDKVVLQDVRIDTDGLPDRIEADLDGVSDFNIIADLYDANITVDALTFNDLSLDKSGQAVFSEMTFDGMALAFLDPSFSSNLKIGQITLVKPSPEFAAWVAGLFGKGEETSPPAPEEIAFDSLTLSGLTWKDPDLSDEHASSMQTLSLEKVKDDKLGSLTMSDLNLKFYDAFSPQPGVLSLKSLNLKGGNAGFLSATQTTDPFESVSDIVEALFSMPLDDGIDHLSLNGLEFSLDGVTAGLPEVSYHVKRDDKGMPLTSELQPFTLTISADPESGLLGAGMSPYLSAFGIDDLRLSAGYTSKYDPKTDTVQTSGNYLEVNEAFRIAYDFKGSGVKDLQEELNGFDPEEVLSGEIGAQELAVDLYSKLDLHAFRLTIEDQGAISKVVALTSIMQGISPDEVRQRMNGLMALGMFAALMLGVDESILEEFNDASRTFIEEGGSLTLTMAPTEPVSLDALMDEPSIATKEALGFSIQHSKPNAE